MKTNNNFTIKDKSMRIIYTLSLVSLLFFFGCDRDSGIISPVSLDNSPVYDGSKSQIIDVIESPKFNPTEYDETSQDIADLYPSGVYPSGSDSIFISTLNLPPSEMPNLVVSKVIDGNQGGNIAFDYEYQTTAGDIISIWANLFIVDESFVGIEEISMIIDNEIGTISFYPHIVFEIPAIFDAKYTGIDLSGINPNSGDFIFQNYDGSTEQINYQEIIVKPVEGQLEVKKAKLNHFSRYGFVN